MNVQAVATTTTTDDDELAPDGALGAVMPSAEAAIVSRASAVKPVEAARTSNASPPKRVMMGALCTVFGNANASGMLLGGVAHGGGVINDAGRADRIDSCDPGLIDDEDGEDSREGLGVRLEAFLSSCWGATREKIEGQKGPFGASGISGVAIEAEGPCFRASSEALRSIPIFGLKPKGY